MARIQKPTGFFGLDQVPQYDPNAWEQGLSEHLVQDARAYREAAEKIISTVTEVDYASLDPAYSHRAPDVRRSALNFGFMRMFVLDDEYDAGLLFVKGAPSDDRKDPLLPTLAIYTTPATANHVEYVAGAQDDDTSVNPVRLFTFLSQIFNATLLPKDPGVSYEPTARQLLPGVKDAITVVKRGALASIVMRAAHLRPSGSFGTDSVLHQESNRKRYAYLRQQTTPFSLKELYSIGTTVVEDLLVRSGHR